MSTPINMMQNPAHSATQIQTQKMEMAQNEIKGLGQTKLSEAEKAAKLRETCESFESIFIQKMWQQMRATLPQENPLVGREEKFWQSMYDQEFSKKMAEGGGIGLADMMYEQLSENLFNVSKTTAGANRDGKGFEIQAAPMLPNTAVGAAPAMALTEQESSLNAQDASKVASEKPEQKFAALYESVPHDVNGANGANGANSIGSTVPNAQQNTTAVQQFLAGLQSKQGGQGGSVQSSSLTGPERAAQVQQIVGSPPPQNGVLPMPTVSKVTYTTNIPKGQRSGDAESHMKELMAKAAANNAAQSNLTAQPWQQASAQQQASHAVQEALRKAQETVASQQVSQATNMASSLTLAPVQAAQGQTAQGPSAPTHPYTVPPTAPTLNKEQS